MTEAPISAELLEKVLSSVTTDAVLVGGQALAVWVGHYGVPLRGALCGAISDDADFLGTRADVKAIATGLPGAPQYPPQTAITALVGQVTIRTGPTEFVNVDVIDKVVGIPADIVRKRASEAVLGVTRFFIMHPLDVLLSRVENLAQLKDKQNIQGIEQTRLATLVAREYIAEIAQEPGGVRHALKAIEHVASIAKSGAGKKITREFGISFLTAIPEYAIDNQKFHTVRWPQLLDEMNAASESLAAFIQQGRFVIKQLNRRSGEYVGLILWADDHNVIQSLGRGDVCIHNVQDWAETPTVGNSVAVRYRDGIASIIKSPERDRKCPSFGM